MRLYLTIFLVFLLTCSSGVLLFAQAVEKNKVKEIKIVDNKVISSATILSKLRTRKGVPFSQDMLNEDLRRLYELGFFEDIAIDVEEEEDGFIVSFIVVEKPVVDTITFKGNRAIKETKLREEISVKEEEMLDRSKLRRDLIAIRKLYESKGFQLANVDYDVEADKDTNRANVIFRVSAVRVAMIRNLINNENVLPSVRDRCNSLNQEVKSTSVLRLIPSVKNVNITKTLYVKTIVFPA